MGRIFFTRNDAFDAVNAMMNPVNLEMIVDEHHGKVVFNMTSFIGKLPVHSKLKCELRYDGMLRFESFTADSEETHTALSATDLAGMSVIIGNKLMNPFLCKPRVSVQNFDVLFDDDWEIGLQAAIDFVKTHVPCRINRKDSRVSMASNGSTPYFEVAVKLADFNFCDAIIILQPKEDMPIASAFEVVGLHLPASMPIDVAKEIGVSIGGEDMVVTSHGDYLLLQ